MGHLPVLKVSGVIRDGAEKVSAGHIGKPESVVIVHLLKFQKQEVDICIKPSSYLDDIIAVLDVLLDSRLIKKQIGGKEVGLILGCVLDIEKLKLHKTVCRFPEGPVEQGGPSS